MEEDGGIVLGIIPSPDLLGVLGSVTGPVASYLGGR